MCKLSRRPTSICLERMEFIYLFIPKDVGVGVYVRKLFQEFWSPAGYGILSFQIGSIRHREAGPPYGGVGIPFLIPALVAENCPFSQSYVYVKRKKYPCPRSRLDILPTCTWAGRQLFSICSVVEACIPPYTITFNY